MSIILKAPHRESERPAAEEHVGVIAAEDQVSREATIHGTCPIAAAGAYIVERTIAVVAVAGNGQLKGRGKGAGTLVAAPTQALSVQFGFCG